MRSAVIDLGTAALRASVFEAGPEGVPLVHADHRVVLGLERTLRRTGAIGRGRLELVVETLRRARQVAFRDGAQRLHAVVAAGLRDAPELPALLAAMAVTLEVAPEVRTRAREAELVLLATGQAAAGPAAAGPAATGPAATGPAATGPATRGEPDGRATVGWLLDLGPYELRLFQADPRGRITRGAVLDLGTELLRPPASVDPAAPWVAERLRREVVRQLAPIASTLLPAAGVGWLLSGPLAAPLTAMAGPVLERESLRAIGQQLLGASATQRLLVPAVDPERADELAVGAVLLATVLEQLAASGLHVTAADASDGQLVVAVGGGSVRASVPPLAAAGS
jgi:hypothetical protein